MFKLTYECWDRTNESNSQVEMLTFGSFDRAEQNFKILLKRYLYENNIDKKTFRSLNDCSYTECLTNLHCALPLYKNDPNGAKGYIKLTIETFHDRDVDECFWMNDCMKLKEE